MKKIIFNIGQGVCSSEFDMISGVPFWQITAKVAIIPRGISKILFLSGSFGNFRSLGSRIGTGPFFCHYSFWNNVHWGLGLGLRRALTTSKKTFYPIWSPKLSPKIDNILLQMALSNYLEGPSGPLISDTPALAMRHKP